MLVGKVGGGIPLDVEGFIAGAKSGEMTFLSI